MAKTYAGAEDETDYGRIPVADAFVVDTVRIVRHKRVSGMPADRAYANYVRHFVRNGHERPYADE